MDTDADKTVTSFNPTQIDAVFRRIDRPVWIVTAADGERRGGLAATWVSQASIDPARPVLAIALAVNHFTRELVDGSGAFAAHLIGPARVELAWRFALGSGRDRDKLADVAWWPGETGSPILAGCAAWLECRVFDRHDGGDRIYYWAYIVAAENSAEGSLLTESELVRLATDEQKQVLRAGLAADVALQRLLYEAWRREIKGK